MYKYKCVIFDCDGVLVDSETIGNNVLVAMANAHGANIDLHYAFKYFKGGSLQGCVDKIEGLINKELPNTFVSDYRERSYEAFKKQIKPVEGIKDLLDNLELPFCVASSGPRDKIELNLSLTGLLPKFEHKIFSAYDIQKWKPDPAIFLWAAETMGFKPEECIVIEDSLSGVQAALNGDFDVYGFTAHDYNNELEDMATLTFKTMTQLLKMLKK